jgi:predicted nucleic acid-binding protein
MLPLRLVLDTNVIVSAVLRPDGLQRTVVLFAITAPARMFVSSKILMEYEATLRKPRLKLREDRIAAAMEMLQLSSTL